MSINFFDTECQETPINALKFGLCDDKKGAKAYSDISTPKKWVATVENPETKAITFTAIDNCIKILKADGNDERRCDVMLTYTENIVFVELKDDRKDWIPDAIGQLETTIQVFSANHNLTLHRHKRAFACNKKHTRFQVIETEIKRRFFDTYRVRLNIQGIIKV